MAPKIKGGKVRSLKSLKQEVKKGGGNYSLKRIPANDSITVRFLDEPHEWYKYTEFFSKEDGYFPDFEGLDPDVVADLDRPSTRYLAAAVDVADNNPIAIVLPKSLVQKLMMRHEKYSTILDRDYELLKEGQGKEGTQYDAIPEPPSKFNANRITPPDLMKALQESIPANLGGVDDDDDEDLDDDVAEDEDEPIRSRRKSRKAGARKPASRRRPEPEDDEDEDEDDEPPARTRRKRPSTGSATKTTIRKKRPSTLRKR